MGIRFYCPNGHKLNVKEFQAGRRGICPYCGAKIEIPTHSTRKSSKELRTQREAAARPAALAPEIPEPVPSADPPGPVLAEPPGSGGEADEAADQRPPENAAPIVSAPIAQTPASVESVSPPTAEPAQADPLAEGGDVVWYVRPASGGQFGPASANVMRNWIDEGRVGADSLVWREGWRDWREASQVFPQLGADRVEPVLEGLPTGGSAAAAAIVPAAPAAAVPVRSVRNRRQSKTAQAAIISALIVAVLVLLCVFIWVLLRDPGERSAPATAPAAAELKTCFENGGRTGSRRYDGVRRASKPVDYQCRINAPTALESRRTNFKNTF